MMYTDLMIDIETVGRTPGCAIIQIAAVPFNMNTGAISDNIFRSSINLDHQLESGKGFTYCPNTYKWWMKENPELFKRLSRSSMKYNQVGSEFQSWFNKLNNSKNIRVWGNSSRFDLGIIEGWYKKAIGYKFEPFWNTWLERDVRTLAMLNPKIKADTKFIGTKHDAIDDCKHQIKYCRAIVRKYKLKVN